MSGGGRKQLEADWPQTAPSGNSPPTVSFSPQPQARAGRGTKAFIRRRRAAQWSGGGGAAVLEEVDALPRAQRQRASISGMESCACVSAVRRCAGISSRPGPFGCLQGRRSGHASPRNEGVGAGYNLERAAKKNTLSARARAPSPVRPAQPPRPKYARPARPSHRAADRRSAHRARATRRSPSTCR